jgi:ferredoxin-NADP reductase
MATPIRFAVEVAAVHRHSEDVATYEFRYLDKRPRHKPGQFLHLALDPYDPAGHWPESRVFTLANGATNQDVVRLTIADKGKFTHRILSELCVGSRVFMKAPYGEFVVRTDPQAEVVLIAGGTGVTPFVAFMEDAMVKGLDGRVWLHYGAREPDLLVFRELAEQCATRFPHFQTRYYAETGAAEGITRGRIDLNSICGALGDVSRATFYLCGPPVMIDVFSERLKSQFGVAPTQIKVDDWE